MITFRAMVCSTEPEVYVSSSFQTARSSIGINLQPQVVAVALVYHYRLPSRERRRWWRVGLARPKLVRFRKATGGWSDPLMVILGMVSGGVCHMRHLHRCIWKVHSEPPGALALHFCHFPSGCRVLIHRIDFRGFQLSKSFKHIFQKPRNAKKYGGCLKIGWKLN